MGTIYQSAPKRTTPITYALAEGMLLPLTKTIRNESFPEGLKLGRYWSTMFSVSRSRDDLGCCYNRVSQSFIARNKPHESATL